MGLQGRSGRGWSGIAEFQDKIGDSLPLDRRARAVGDVKLVELDQPLHKSAGQLWLLHYLFQRLVNEDHYGVGLEVRTKSS